MFRHRNFLKIAGAHAIRWFESTRTSFGACSARAWVRFGGEEAERHPLSYSVRVCVGRSKRGPRPPATSLGHLSTPSQACSAPMLCSAGSSSKDHHRQKGPVICRLKKNALISLPLYRERKYTAFSLCCPNLRSLSFSPT